MQIGITWIAVPPQMITVLQSCFFVLRNVVMPFLIVVVHCLSKLLLVAIGGKWAIKPTLVFACAPLRSIREDLYFLGLLAVLCKSVLALRCAANGNYALRQHDVNALS